uniref:Armadillo repeat containing 4 n=1 Tax=Amphiprion ocellaris TaxID=80972 RepID=A0AAQ5YSG9_AMPOC
MGLSLTKAAQWTTASSGTGKLEFTPMNESLLKEILCFVEQFSSQHPQEAEHVFEEPLQWRTTLVASDFKTEYDISDSAVQSHEKDSEGLPLLQFSPPAVYVRSFSQLSKLVHLADDKKLEEVRTCLEENRDPVVKILGRSFATALEREDTQTDILSLVDKVKDPAKDSETKVKLCLLLHNMDKQILSKLLEEISEKVSLNPTAVKNEVELLKQLCSEGEKRALKSLRYTSDFEFSNGCRTPLWRQPHGEICYLVIEPCDTETLYITYSTAGVFLNEGIKQEGEESGYERTSDVYTDLVTLLKSRSPHFAENINEQDFAAQKLPSTHKFQHVESVDGEKQGQPQRSYEQQEKNVHEKTKQQHTVNKAGNRNKYGSSKIACCYISSLCLIMYFLSYTYSVYIVICWVLSALFLFSKTSAGAVPVELESSTDSEEEEEQPARHPEGNTDLPPEYWQIQKLVKYLKASDQKATVLTLYAMMDLNLMQETCQLAIRDLGGLEILLNLLDTKEVRCKIGSLKILRKISHNMQISRTIVDMRGLQRMVTTLDSPNKDLKALSAETIANVARFHRARKIVRNLDGIKKLVKLLDCGTPNLAQVSANQEKDVEVARCGVLALWSCSKSCKNKEAIRKAGGIPLLGRLLKSPHANMLIPVVGTLQECSSEESYRVTIQTEGMIKDLVKNLRSDNDELQMHCASAIFKCAEEKETRDLVRKYKGLQQLVSLLGKADNKQLLAAATGAIWKCSISTDNVAEFQKHNALQTLVGLLTDQPEEVLVNVAGALGEFAQIPANKPTIGKCGGIKPLVNLLIGTNQALLVNVTKALGACATDKDNMTIIQQLDGVRLVWSLLKKPSPDVQSSAAWALCPCIENAKDAGEMVRSLVGGLELILNLLKSTNNEVLASICAAIAKIARDEENLAVLTDHGVIPLLTKLTDTTDDRLRHHLAEAIYYCCMWGNNRESFGEAQAVAPLVRFLKSKDTAVHLSTAKALYQLSWVPNNVITMYERGVVKVSCSVVVAAFLSPH